MKAGRRAAGQAGSRAGGQGSAGLPPQGAFGFTLVEVTISLVILAITAAVAVPALRQLTELSPVSRTGEDVARILRGARRTALERGIDVRVTLNPATAAYTASADSAGTPIELATGTIAVPPEVTLTGAGPRARWIFHRLGSTEGDSLFVRDDATIAIIAADRWTGDIVVRGLAQ